MALSRRRSTMNSTARSVFVDTWGWLTLRDRREAQHQEVARFYQRLRSSGAPIITTDYVLVETFTLLFKRLPGPQATTSLQMLMQATNAGYVRLERITTERFSETLVLRERFLDKPNISFTDLSSMVVMQELGITMILTGDAHFTHVGMGFQVVPP